MTLRTPRTEPLGCPTPGACSAVEEIDALRKAKQMAVHEKDALLEELIVRRTAIANLHEEIVTDKERIAELADSFNRVCDENADFVAHSVTDENRIAKLEAQVKHAEGHAAELEAENKALRKSGIGLIGILEEILYAISIDKNCSERTRTAAATLEQRIKAVREGK